MKFRCNYDNEEYPECDPEELERLQQVDSICEEKGLQWRYFPVSGFLFLYSKIGVWKLKLRAQQIILHHQNRLRPVSNYQGNFHRQQYKFKSLKSAILYIAKHDTNKYQKEYHRIQDTSIEKAFRKVRREKKDNV